MFGAAGHTGRFVVAELVERGWSPVVAGRDEGKLRGLGEVRVAKIDDPASLDAMLRGARAVINCAGPFLDTALPVVEAAVRNGVHYLDVAAEQAAARAVFEGFAKAPVAIVPAMAFYGGLADLLATTAMGELAEADDIRVGIALDRWQPTLGTRKTGERNNVPRVVVREGRLQPLVPSSASWEFPEPFGAQAMTAVPFTEVITIARHLRAREVSTYLNTASLAELRDPATPAPTAVDDRGRSAQQFVMEVRVRAGEQERRMTARGRDIYAITAPIVVEAAERLCDGRAWRTGAVAAGEAFEAREFLAALAPHLAIG